MPATALASLFPPDGRQSQTALNVARGTTRLLHQFGFSAVSELALPAGRRSRTRRDRSQRNSEDISRGGVAMLRTVIAAALICLLVDALHAAERVQFESAHYQMGPLQQRLARERGEAIAPPPAEIVSGYLTKPEGDGPFPAIVHLHGCNGLSKAFKDGADKGQWSEQLAAWGYAVLV